MKKTLITMLIVLFGTTVFAQNADDICGIFHSVDPFSKEGSQCQIYKAADGTYEAKVVWVENPKKKNQLGLVFMTGLTYNAKEKEYQNIAFICIFLIRRYPGKQCLFPGIFFNLRFTTNLKNGYVKALSGSVP